MVRLLLLWLTPVFISSILLSLIHLCRLLPFLLSTLAAATPVKVAFPHPEELSKTNDHAAIKQEARKMSKRAYASVAAAILGAGGNGEEEVAEASRSSKKRDSSEVIHEKKHQANPVPASVSGVQSPYKHAQCMASLRSPLNPIHYCTVQSAVSMDPENAPPSARGKIARGDSVGDVVRNPLGNAN